MERYDGTGFCSIGLPTNTRARILDGAAALLHGEILAYQFGEHARDGEGYKYLYLAIKTTDKAVIPLVTKFKVTTLHHPVLKPKINFHMSLYVVHTRTRQNVWKCFPQKILDVLTPTTDAAETAWREACTKENAIRAETRARFKHLA